MIHDEDCEAALYDGGVCICGDDEFSGPVYGEVPSSHDGRLTVLALFEDSNSLINRSGDGLAIAGQTQSVVYCPH